jgi:hypothetical protein
VVPARLIVSAFLCGSCSSARRFPIAFLPRSVTLPELASGSDLFHVFMSRFSHRGLSPHLQRAHAGAHNSLEVNTGLTPRVPQLFR